MNSPLSSSPSSSPKLPSFDVFWHTKNLLLPLETPTRSTRLSYTQEYNNNQELGNIGGTKRNSTIATLPSPTVLSRVGSTSSSLAADGDVITELKGRTRLNKRTRRTVSNRNKDDEIGLDEDTLKTLGVLAARLSSSSASTSHYNNANRSSSLPNGRIGGSSKIVDGNNVGKNLGRSLTSGIVVSMKGKEREVVRANIEKVSTKRSNETHSSTSNLAPTERLLPASLTKFRASTTTTISSTSKPTSAPSVSKPLPLLSKTLPSSRTSIITTTTTAAAKKDEFDDYFNSADDEFFELALSQLEAESITGGSSAIKKPQTTASKTTNVKQAQVGIPPGRILVPPTRASPRFGSGSNNNTNTTIPFNSTTSNNLTSNNNKSNGNKILPTSLPPPRSLTSITTTTTTNIGIPKKSNTSTTTTTLKSENSFRFSGPATRATSTSLPSKSLQLNPIPTKPSVISMGKPNVRSNSNSNSSTGLKGLGKSISLKEKKEMEELLRLEMKGLEEMGCCVDDWSDGEF